VKALLLLLIPCAALAALPAPGSPGSINDPRYCGEPKRDKHGRILRSRAVLRRFAKVFPCPSTLKPIPSCPGWAIDHPLPLASGGCDAQINLQWLPTAIKACAAPACKDRWERIYHAVPRQPVNLKGTP
jgi:hypothetical protein